jgi:hypothetical protein
MRLHNACLGGKSFPQLILISGSAVVCIGKHQAEKAKQDQAGLESGLDDPKAVLIMVYRQSRGVLGRLSRLVWRLFSLSLTDCCRVQSERFLQSKGDPEPSGMAGGGRGIAAGR